MIISEEQVRRAAEYLQTQSAYTVTETTPLSDEAAAAIIGRVAAALSELPDVRADRVAEARILLAGTMPSTDVVAGKLIGRVISDAIR
jgi:hypothetical protein